MGKSIKKSIEHFGAAFYVLAIKILMEWDIKSESIPRISPYHINDGGVDKSVNGFCKIYVLNHLHDTLIIYEKHFTASILSEQKT